MPWPHPQSHASTCPTASEMPLALNAHLCPAPLGAPTGQHTPFLMALWPNPYPHVPIAELGLIQGKTEPAVTEHGAWAPRDRSIFAATGTSRGRLGAGGTAGRYRRVQHLDLHLPVPPKAPALLWAPGSGINSLDTEQGHKGAGAERAGCVEVGVIRCPASHNLLIIYQRITRTAQGAARQQNL